MRGFAPREPGPARLHDAERKRRVDHAPIQSGRFRSSWADRERTSLAPAGGTDVLGVHARQILAQRTSDDSKEKRR